MNNQAALRAAFAAAQASGVVFADMKLIHPGKNWLVTDCNGQIKAAFGYAAGVQGWLQRCTSTGYQVAPTVEESYRRSAAPIAAAEPFVPLMPPRSTFTEFRSPFGPKPSVHVRYERPLEVTVKIDKAQLKTLGVLKAETEATKKKWLQLRMDDSPDAEIEAAHNAYLFAEYNELYRLRDLVDFMVYQGTVNG